MLLWDGVIMAPSVFCDLCKKKGRGVQTVPVNQCVERKKNTRNLMGVKIKIRLKISTTFTCIEMLDQYLV